MSQAAANAAFQEIASAWMPAIDEALGARLQFTDQPDAWGRICPDSLQESMRYSTLLPGKRLRPLLTLLAAESCGGSVEAAMPAACAVEMVHTYSLIHDDLPIMDDDDLRRGHPTNHKVYGDALAVLAGDALLTRAFEILATEIKPGVLAASCCATLAQAAGATGLVGGQVDDLAAEHHDGNLDLVAAIHARKTAAMLWACCRLGGMCAGASSPRLQALELYGHRLGLAFQIADDLLDVEGSQSEVGKRLGKDEDRGKLTYPAVLGIEASRQQAGALIDEACSTVRQALPQAERLEALARYVLERDR